MRVEIGGAQRNCVGEEVCGDGYCVFEDENRYTIAVADGLGHGPEAAVAAVAFLKSVEKHRENSDLPNILQSATKEISGTRGVAAALVRISKKDGKLSFSGVGNIEFVSKSSQAIRPICSPGIVGRPIRSVRQFDYEISPGDYFAIFSDGVSTKMDFNQYADRLTNEKNCSPETIAQSIIDDHGKYHDDGTCIVIRLKE